MRSARLESNPSLLKKKSMPPSLSVSGDDFVEMGGKTGVVPDNSEVKRWGKRVMEDGCR